MAGLSTADGTTLALAALQQSDPLRALILLAASSALANFGYKDLEQSHGVGDGRASQGLTNPNLAGGPANADADADAILDNRLERLENEVQRLTYRNTRLEGILRRLLSIIQNGNADATEASIPTTWETQIASLADIILLRLEICSRTLAFDGMSDLKWTRGNCNFW